MVTPEAQWHKDHPLRNWKISLFAGLSLTVLLSGIVSSLTTRPVRLEKLVQEKTEELSASEEKWRSIIENSSNMFYSHTPEHVLTFVSPQVKDILGYTADEVLTRWTDIATNHPTNERAMQLTEEAIRAGKAQPVYEAQFTHKNGTPVWVEVREAPVVKGGKTIAIVGSLTDITERKKAEEDLKQKMDELNRFNKAAVGREMRMIELKKEVNALCRELGRDAPYPTSNSGQ